MHLQQGDTLAVKTAIIDSKEVNPNSITIDDDITLDVHGIPYQVNVAVTPPVSSSTDVEQNGFINQRLDAAYGPKDASGTVLPQRYDYETDREYPKISTSAQDKTTPDNNKQLAALFQPDYGRYMACKAQNGQNVQMLLSQKFKHSGGTGKKFEHGFRVKFSFTASDGQNTVKWFSIEGHEVAGKETYVLENVNILVLNNAGSVGNQPNRNVVVECFHSDAFLHVKNNPNAAPEGDITGDDGPIGSAFLGRVWGSPTLLGADTFEPVYFRATVNIAKGVYAPDELCKVVNDQINSLSDDQKKLGTGSDLFQQSNSMGTMSFIREKRVVKFTHEYAFQYSPQGNVWVGASQFQMSFNANTNKFQFDFAHTPFYDSQSAIAVQNTYYHMQNKVYDLDADGNIPNGFGPDPAYGSSTSYGGLMLTNLSSRLQTDAQNVPTELDFWATQVGINPTAIVAQVTNNQEAFVLKTLANETNQDQTTKIFAPVYTNQQFTDAMVTSDVIFDKKNVAWQVDDAKQFASIIDADSTNPITGQIPLTEMETTLNGYYLIDIQGIHTTTVGSSNNTTSHSLQGIVSRYYSQAGYTTGDSDNGIPYTHSSAMPLTLSSLKVRILQPDGTLANDVGNDSTIFLQLIRAQQK